MTVSPSHFFGCAGGRVTWRRHIAGAMLFLFFGVGQSSQLSPAKANYFAQNYFAFIFLVINSTMLS
jgi:hypothetical protein